MRKHWGFYDNGTYRVGCNGASIYVYDQNNNEIGRFKESYAYDGMFQPNTNIFVTKTTEGSLGIYDLDKMERIKKIVITRIGGQDEGFAFTPDGEFFFNIEKPVDTTETQLAIYRTVDFEKVDVLFSNEKKMVLDTLEFDELSGDCYVLGFMRNNTDGSYDYGFIGKLIDKDIKDIKTIANEEYDYIQAYKSWELSGKTPKRLEWLYIDSLNNKTHISLKQIYNG